MDDKVTRSILEALRDGDRSGYEVWKWLRHVRGVPAGLTEANLYPILYRLEASRIIRGDTREAGGVIRRVYRVAGRGLDLARKQEWVAVTLHGETRASAQTTLAGPGAEALSDGDAQSALDDFIATLGIGLRLATDLRSGIQIEIRDHLEDSVDDIARSASSASEAAAEAVSRLGPPDALAGAISSAQLTRRRLAKAIRVGGYQAVLAGAIGLAGGGIAVLLTPFIARFIATAALPFGIHLYLPETAEWRDQQFLATFWIAVFMAGRISAPRVARESRRTEKNIRLPWALGGVALLVPVALLAPMSLDFLVAVGLLGVPVAFAVGVWRSQGAIDDPISKRGLATAAPLLAILLFTPGFRAFAFDAGAVPQGNPSPAILSTVQVSWDQAESGSSVWHVDVTGLYGTAWHDAVIEFWPAARQGPLIAPDAQTTSATARVTPGEAVDIAMSPRPVNWWVTVTAVGSDGQRHTVHSEVHPGPESAGLDNLLGWILGRR